MGVSVTLPTPTAFLMQCAEMGLSVSIGTTWDTAHLVDVDRLDPKAGKQCQYLVRVRPTKHASVAGHFAIREIGPTPWAACLKAEEKLKAIVASKKGARP